MYMTGIKIKQEKKRGAGAGEHNYNDDVYDDQRRFKYYLWASSIIIIPNNIS